MKSVEQVQLKEMSEQAESRIAEDGIVSHETPGKKVGEKMTNSEFSRPEFRRRLEHVMNSIRNALGMRGTEISREPRRPWNPHFYAVFAQVHNTL
jgi:hypothetical protein